MFLFDGNSAIVGSGVYTNYLSLCSWVNDTEPYFDDKRVYRWDTFDYRYYMLCSQSMEVFNCI